MIGVLARYIPLLPNVYIVATFTVNPPPFMLQAYVRSHINTAIYVLDFLKHAKARGDEKRLVDEYICALTRLLHQVCLCVLVFLPGTLDRLPC